MTKAWNDLSPGVQGALFAKPLGARLWTAMRTRSHYIYEDQRGERATEKDSEKPVDGCAEATIRDEAKPASQAC